MSRLKSYCIDLLVNAHGVSKADAPGHPFTVHCSALEAESNRARWLYPFLYLVLGLILISLVMGADLAASDRWNNMFGAVVGVFSALLAFWKPNVELLQSNAQELLNGKRITTADLVELNKMLALPSKSFDRVIKLVSALCSFLAIYLLTGK